MLEKDFQKEVVNYLRKVKKAFVIEIEGLERGLPDLIVGYQSRFFGFELKVKYTIQPHQVAQLKRIIKAGCWGYELKYHENWQHTLDIMLEGKWEQVLEEVEWNG